MEICFEDLHRRLASETHIGGSHRRPAMKTFIEYLETNDGDFHWRSALDSNDRRLPMMRSPHCGQSRLTDGLTTCNRHLLSNVDAVRCTVSLDILFRSLFVSDSASDSIL